MGISDYNTSLRHRLFVAKSYSFLFHDSSELPSSARMLKTNNISPKHASKGKRLIRRHEHIRNDVISQQYGSFGNNIRGTIRLRSTS